MSFIRSKKKQILEIVQGGSGTGKTFLAIKRSWTSVNVRVKRGACLYGDRRPSLIYTDNLIKTPKHLFFVFIFFSWGNFPRGFFFFYAEERVGGVMTTSLESVGYFFSEGMKIPLGDALHTFL